MRQQAKLDLGIVGIDEDVPILRNENLANLTSQFHTNRYILKIWLRTADSSRSRDGLVKSPVYSLIRPDIDGQAFCIGGIQLGELTVIQNHLHYRIIGSQFVQHVGRRRIPGLRLFPVGKFHMVKQDFAQLFGRIDIKRFPRLLINLLFQYGNLYLQAVSVLFQPHSLRLDSHLLHVEKAVDQRHLNIGKEAVHLCPLQFLRQTVRTHKCDIPHIADARKCLLLIGLQSHFYRLLTD